MADFKDTPFSIDECIGPSLHNLAEQFHYNIYEIYYLTKGNVGYFINGKSYNITEGDIVIIPPNTLHKTVPKNDQIRNRILLYLRENSLDEFDSQDVSLWKEVSIFHSEKGDRTEAIFYELLEEYRNKQNKALLKALTCELVILLQREKDKKTSPWKTA